MSHELGIGYIFQELVIDVVVGLLDRVVQDQSVEMLGVGTVDESLKGVTTD